MKKTLLTLCAMVMALGMHATTVLFGGTETAHHVSWDTPLNFEAAKFSDAKPGNILKIQYANAADGMEIKVIDTWNYLVGYTRTEPVWVSGEGAYEMILSAPAVADIKAHGLQIIGAGFDCKMAELLDGEAENLKEGDMLWKGFFWMDEWSTQTIYIKGFNNWSKYKEMRVYHEANRSEYVINVLSQFDKEGAKVAESAITKEDTCAVIDLTKVNMEDVINASDAKNVLLIQMNKESGAAFNMTDIVLVPKSDPSAFENVQRDNVQCTKVIRNGQILILRDGKTYNALGTQL